MALCVPKDRMLQTRAQAGCLALNKPFSEIPSTMGLHTCDGMQMGGRPGESRVPCFKALACWEMSLKLVFASRRGSCFAEQEPHLPTADRSQARRNFQASHSPEQCKHEQKETAACCDAPDQEVVPWTIWLLFSMGTREARHIVHQKSPKASSLRNITNIASWQRNLRSY